MATFKCKMCGGSLEIAEGMTVCECEYCGTQQTLPKTDNEQTLSMFNRANHFRQQCEFDKAAEIYERMTAQSDDAELYWSIVLCRYGIEYVDDPLTHKKIATCHRTQYKSILEDADYLEALSHADSIQRSVYEREAAYIDKVQKGILEISNKEEPFDVFICYKESDQNGRRTQDSVLAQELYYQLEREGFKVFFSRITLESKLGTEYEPYIFAALNSARVMVVVGTKPEYFNAVWVKNEWSRYLMLMQQDRSRVLIPAYKDMDPYDLPDALSLFQAQDMSKLGFMQDLIRGISKIANKEEPKPAAAPSPVQTVVQKTSGNIENLLKRGFLSLEDQKWDEADRFFEDVLNENVEEPRAYIGKLCAEKKVTSEESLVTLQNDFSDSNNYKKACRFGGKEVESRLHEYILQGIYNRASELYNKANNLTSFYNVIELFKKIKSYKDSAEMITMCNKQIDKLKLEEKRKQYNNAINEMNNAASEQSFIQAGCLFEKLGDFQDSVSKAKECRNMAEQAALKVRYDIVLQRFIETNKKYDDNTVLLTMEKGEKEYKNIANQFDELGDFLDAPQKSSECLNRAEGIRKDIAYKNAKISLEFAKVDEINEAIEKLEVIRGWKDVDDTIGRYKAKIKEIEETATKEKKTEKRAGIIAFIILSIVVVIAIGIIVKDINKQKSSSVQNIYIPYTGYHHSYKAARVSYSHNGHIDYDGADVTFDDCGVRPALTIKLK